MYRKVYIEITNICNMNCSFCHGHKRIPRQMNREEFTLILDKLTGQTKFLYYHLMGEPLTHPLLPEFIKLAGERGYKSIITTNGTLLKKRGEALLAAGIHKVNISVHSFEKGTEDDHKQYISEIAKFSKNAVNQGVVVALRLWNQGSDEGKNEFTLKCLKESIPGDWLDNPHGIRIRNKLYLEWGERFEWPDEDAQIKGDKFSCYGLKDHFGILSDGTVVPCCLDSDGIINLGNIFQQDIASILNSRRAIKMVEGFQCGEASEDLCKRCGFAQRFV